MKKKWHMWLLVAIAAILTTSAIALFGCGRSDGNGPGIGNGTTFFPNIGV